MSSETDATDISALNGLSLGVGASGGYEVVASGEKTIGLGDQPYSGSAGSVGLGLYAGLPVAFHTFIDNSKVETLGNTQEIGWAIDSFAIGLAERMVHSAWSN